MRFMRNHRKLQRHQKSTNKKHLISRAKVILDSRKIFRINYLADGASPMAQQ